MRNGSTQHSWDGAYPIHVYGMGRIYIYEPD